MTWVLVATACGALALTLWPARTRQADDEQRPGSDEQWADLADAMRRYRKHKARRSNRG